MEFDDHPPGLSQDRNRRIEAMLPDSPYASFVCLPRPDAIVIYDQFDITCFRLVDPTVMGEGDHFPSPMTIWTQHNRNPLAKPPLIYHVSLIERP